jgi:hypothetical protein
MGGWGMLPPCTSTPEVFSLQEENKTTEKNKVAMGDAMGMMRYFQSILEALTNHLDHDEGRYFVPIEASHHPPIVSGSVHRELEKVKFSEFWCSTDGLAAKYWLDNMEMCFSLRDYTSKLNFCMGV